MIEYNYGTAVNKLIYCYEEMLELLIRARLASNRIDEWKKILDLVTNPDQTHASIKYSSLASPITKRPNFYRDYL